MSTLQAVIAFAAETSGHDSDKTLFYIAGIACAVWAVIVSAIGIKRHENWPSSNGVATAIMGISAVLVVFAMATSILTS